MNRLLSLHIAVLLFGLAGLFSKFLALPATTIVWGRTTFAVAAIIVYLLVSRQTLKLRRKSDAYLLIAQGVLLAVHWFTFFYSIQISSVAIGLLSCSTFPVFVMALESFFYKQPIKLRDLLGIAVILAGVAVLVPEFEFSNQSVQGIIWGVFSGFLFAVLTLLNRKLSKDYSPPGIALIQNAVAALVLTPFAIGTVSSLANRDWLLLIILGIFCTALAHALFIHALTRTRAFIASITASLEPVYGILAAFILLGEIPTLKELTGGAMILAATIFISLKSSKIEVDGLKAQG